MNAPQQPPGEQNGAPEIDLAQLVAETDTGGRDPQGLARAVLLGVALVWSLFQLWIASPLPFALGFGVFNDTESRSLHLGFALLLAFLAYPAFGKSPRDRIPVADWVLGLIAAFCGSYLFWFYGAPGGKLGGGKVAGRNVGVGQAGLVAIDDNRGQVVVLASVEHAWFDDGARRKDAHHFSGH